jgi:signal transduction histidine kinase
MPDSSIVPQGRSALWLLEMPWMHGLSGAVTAVACCSILIVVLRFLRRRHEPELQLTGLLLCAFVLVVGAAHAVDALGLAASHDALEGGLKIVTALLSAALVYVAWSRTPAALSIASGGEMERRIHDATAELEQRNVDLNDVAVESDGFVSAASHDLKEPLRTLLAFSALLEQDLPEQLSDDARSDLAHIKSAANRMQCLVDDLLELSTTTRAPLCLTQVSLDECLAEALSVLDEQVRDTAAKIEGSALPSLVTDRRLVTQVLQNLISNAIKFSKPGEPPKVEIDVERGADGGFTIGVADAGIGIPAEARALIFEPFERLHSRDEYDGTGIGLAICQRAINRLGGRIWAEDLARGGTLFKFTIRSAGGSEEITGNAATA